MRNEELKEYYIDERTGIEYKLVGDYYLPNIVLNKPRRTGNIGKYGRLRLKYLEEHYRPEVMIMRVNNELISHLLDIEDKCKSRVGQLVKQMAEEEKVTEELKVNNQMEWVGKMNCIKQCAEEIVCNEIIYK